MAESSQNINPSTSDRILFAAMQIIGEAGLKGLSASKLAQAAQISKSTVFHYFKRMDEIPALILKKLYTEIIDPVQEVNHKNAYTYLKALGHASFSCQPEHLVIYKAFLSLFQASMHDSHLKSIVQECSEQFDALLYNKLRDLCGKNVEESLVKKLSRLISMSLDGIAMHYLIEGRPDMAREAWDLFIDMLSKQHQLT